MRSKSGGGVTECVGVFRDNLLVRLNLLCWMTCMKVRS